MKKFTLTALSFLLIIGMALGQKTNDGGSTGGGTNNNNNNDDNNRGSSNCMSSVLGIGSAMVGQYHKNLLSSSKIDNTMSFEIMPMIGYTLPTDETAAENYLVGMPRIRANYGAFSGDISMDYRTTTDDFTTSSYKVVHALAEFNIIPSNSFKLAIGQGVLYDLDSEGLFHESFLGFEGAFMDKAYTANLEGRFVYDYVNAVPVFWSAELKGGYRILNYSHAQIYANAGFSFQDRNNDFQLVLPFAGVNVVLR
ncbi:MAG: hypothetical protein U9N85_00995 [Bacteroidota bacterium]|nr:hypothetical protein [Bacteroidota bacterium]